MYLGRVVEIGPTERVFADPRHPYTKALLSALLRPETGARGERIVLAGEPPSPESPPPGCPFHPRCPQAMERCKGEVPVLQDIGTAGASHQVSCHLY
jgi:peptide/nickel transport system ATP-binding protein